MTLNQLADTVGPVMLVAFGISILPLTLALLAMGFLEVRRAYRRRSIRKMLDEVKQEQSKGERVQVRMLNGKVMW